MESLVSDLKMPDCLTNDDQEAATQFSGFSFYNVGLIRQKIEYIKVLCKKIREILQIIVMQEKSLAIIKITTQKISADIHIYKEICQDIISRRQDSSSSLSNKSINELIQSELETLVNVQETIESYSNLQCDVAASDLKLHKYKLAEELVDKEEGMDANEHLLHLILSPVTDFKFWPKATRAVNGPSTWLINSLEEVIQTQKALQQSFQLEVTFNDMITKSTFNIRKCIENTLFNLQAKIQELSSNRDILYRQRVLCHRRWDYHQYMVANPHLQQDNTIMLNKLAQQIQELESRLRELEDSLTANIIALEMHRNLHVDFKYLAQNWHF